MRYRYSYNNIVQISINFKMCILYLYLKHNYNFILNIDEFKHWILNNDTCMWIIEKTPQGTDPLPDVPDFDGNTSCFVSTYFLCYKQQTIVFKNHGLTKAVMKLLEPDILFSEW